MGQLGIAIIQKGEVGCTKDGITTNYYNSYYNDAKCIYNNSGECVCENLKAPRIDSCIFRITTDGKQASNDWGQYPLLVSIPSKT